VALPEEGSWISLASDPKGRITIARERRGLLRVTVGEHAIEKVEVIEDTLRELISQELRRQGRQ
jgi:hypothetical protein